MVVVPWPCSPAWIEGKCLRLFKVAGNVLISLYRGLKACVLSPLRLIRQGWAGTDQEEPKVIKVAGLGPAVWKCAIHIPPIAATAAVAALNLDTYFIGTDYLGKNDTESQNFSQLALQVTAKLYELLIVASLATVFIDVLRRELLSGSAGLPLGILLAKTRFVDATYLFSADFRYGICGVTWRKRIPIALFTVACTLIALLAGPSLALLLLPQRYSNWQAGGATFFMTGTKETIWPSQLDGTSIGGAHCKSPTEDTLKEQSFNSSSCIWSGYSSIYSLLQSEHLGYNLVPFDIYDGQVLRHMDLSRWPLCPDTWIIGVPLAVCLYSEIITDRWLHQATLNAPSAALNSLGKYANLRYRDRNASTVVIESELPVVRTNCVIKSPVFFPDMFNDANKAQGPAPVGYSMVSQRLSFSGATWFNSTQISTLWLETPDSEPIGTYYNSNNSHEGLSSAYLNIQIPVPNNYVGALVSCSIDARWVAGQVGGANAGYDVTYYGPIEPTAGSNPKFFPLQNDSTWRTVRLKKDWLDTLTPALGNATGFTSLSSMLTGIGVNNSTGLNLGWRRQYKESNTTDNWQQIRATVEGVVSTLVADGMSRVGYERNGGGTNTILDDDMLSLVSVPTTPNDLDSLLSGTLVLPLPSTAKNASDTTQMRWTVTASGLGYRASSAPYYLALVILFSHAVIALVHTVWMLLACETSTAWGSLTDLVVLALRSTPPEGAALENASAGIECYKTLGEPVRIRVAKAQTVSNGTVVVDGVEMILGTDWGSDKYEDVVIGEAY